MEETPKRSGWKIWVYLIPVYIIVAVPLVKWTMRNESGEVAVKKEDVSAFNSDVGEVKKADLSGYNPELTDLGYTVRYRAGGSKEGSKDEYDMGYVEGRMLRTLGDYMANIQAMEELFNNRWVVKGFMARASSKRAFATPSALRAVLETPGLTRSFLAEKPVDAALNDPKVLAVIVDSDFAKTILAAPAAQALMKDTETVQELLEADPALRRLLARPAVKAAVLASPLTANLAKALGWQ